MSATNFYPTSHHVTEALMVHSNVRGIYIENSCLDDFLNNAAPFGQGPFVISEYSLAEKASLPWSDFVRFLDRASVVLHFLRIPPVTQVLTGRLDPSWNGPIELVPLDTKLARDGRRIAVEKLEAIKRELAEMFRSRYTDLRPHWADYLEKIDSGSSPHLIDPTKPTNARDIVAAATLESLGRDRPPSASDSVPDRLLWTIRTWELAMVFARLERTGDNEKDLRNDPIDAVHYTLAATFCDRIAFKDKGMRRIYDLMPDPKVQALFLQSDGQVRELPRSASP